MEKGLCVFGEIPLFALPTGGNVRRHHSAFQISSDVSVCVVFGGFTREASAWLSAKCVPTKHPVPPKHTRPTCPHICHISELAVCLCVRAADGILIKYLGVYVNLYAHMLSQSGSQLGSLFRSLFWEFHFPVPALRSSFSIFHIDVMTMARLTFEVAAHVCD